MNPPAVDQQERLRQSHQGRGTLAKYFINKMMVHVFERKESPFDLFFWPIKGYLVGKYLENERFRFSQKEQGLMRKLMLYFMDQRQCGERSLGHILFYGTVSKKSITDALHAQKHLTQRVSVIWGEFDFMDVTDSNKRLDSLELHSVRISYAKKSDHQIPFQGVQDVRQELLEALEKITSLKQ